MNPLSLLRDKSSNKGQEAKMVDNALGPKEQEAQEIFLSHLQFAARVEIPCSLTCLQDRNLRRAKRGSFMEMK